jgi:FlaA1/EpsC-like NDP-sugar epimerase
MILRHYAGRETLIASVRFGNVLGSRGSLLSVLESQIERGEMVTITHPDVTRFFMTVEEAVGLVLEAAVMATTGEVFVLDMGEPVLIVDLVRNYTAQLHGNADDVVIRFTGLRPGEKLDETLISQDEERTPTAHPKIWNSRTSTELPADFERSLQQLYAASTENNIREVRRLLAALVPGYRPTLGDSTAAVAPYPDDW